MKLFENRAEGIFLIFISFIALVFFFYKNNQYRLLLGGGIFLSLSLKILIINSGFLAKKIRKEKNSKIVTFEIFTGFIFLILFFIATFSQILSPKNLEIFLTSSLFMISFLAIIIIAIWKKSNFVEKTVYTFSTVFPITLISYVTLGSVMSEINSRGFSHIFFYIQAVLLVSIVIFYTSLLIYSFLDIFSFFKGNFKKIHNFSNSFNFSVVITILIGGYYYMKYISSQDLKDFLIMLGLLLSIWLGAHSNNFKKP